MFGRAMLSNEAITYAALEDSGPKQALIRLVELLSGQQRLVRIYEEAKRNLLYTGMTVAEVAHALGFGDPAYFSRFFARFAGEPPGRFRASRRGDGERRKVVLGSSEISRFNSCASQRPSPFPSNSRGTCRS